MTSTQILETLAKEFSTEVAKTQTLLELLDAGLSAPYIGRCRRSETGGLSETFVRRLQLRRGELEELDRRRATILRLFDASADKDDAASRKRIEACVDRFELEDLFVAHRRPEPEVQLALDRGLGALADQLVAPIPKEERPAPPAKQAPAPGAQAPAAEVPAAEAPAAEAPTAEAPAAEAPAAEAPTAEAPGPEAAPAKPEASAVSEPGVSVKGQGDDSQPAGARHGVLLTPELARACAEHVQPDRGIHTENEALSGALRILSDRLGRSSRLRGTVRRALRKNGVLSVRATTDEKKVGRHKPLLKLKQPLRQVQGHRLLAVRQAQKERAVTALVTLEPRLVLPKVRAALGKFTKPVYQAVLDDVATKALEQRLIPAVEADIRLELKERADEEALRFLSQHLRQVLLAPAYGQRPVAGIDVNAKGDWTVAPLNAQGSVADEIVRIEVGDKEPAVLGAELTKVLDAHDIPVCAVGHGKNPRAAALKVRAALSAAGSRAAVTLVNESGLSSYASGELARRELSERSVPERMAISLGRRLQDPMSEIIKVDPRYLGLGSEQGLVSKANLRRIFDETVESCVAHTGCDANHASIEVLKHVPGLDMEAAKRIVAAREERAFESREDLRREGLLTEAQWTSAIAFLRVYGSSNVLDKTSLHPGQYDLARRIVESAGGSLEDQIGRTGITKGLRRVDFDVDESTWRDLMREISYPGRDPRMRVWIPALLDPQTDRVTLTKDRVVDGVISNVASFGAFVDIGLEHDAMVHISEISDRYVRDARELLSIGQVVRVRILDSSSQRVALSLKNITRDDRRPGGGGGGARGGGARSGGGGRGAGRPGGPRDRGPRVNPNLRAAQARRDGLMPGLAKAERGRGGGGGRGGPGGGGGGGGGGRGFGRGPGSRDRRRGDGDLDVRPEDLKAVNSKASAYNPFAKFFKPEEAAEAEPKAPAEPKGGTQQPVVAEASEVQAADAAVSKAPEPAIPSEPSSSESSQGSEVSEAADPKPETAD